MRKLLLFAIIIATYVEIKDRNGYGPQKPDTYPPSFTFYPSYIPLRDSLVKDPTFKVVPPTPEDIHDPNLLDFDPTSDTFEIDEVEKFRD